MTRLYGGRSGICVLAGARVFAGKRTDTFWGPPCSVFSGYWGYTNQVVKATTQVLSYLVEEGGGYSSVIIFFKVPMK
jgi:hypothetical protein